VEVRFWECRRFGLGMVLNPLEISFQLSAVSYHKISFQLSAVSYQLEPYSDCCVAQRNDQT
jgi:hypothetical protein